MLSTIDLEKLINEKKREIEDEKIYLGLLATHQKANDFEEDKENVSPPKRARQEVKFLDKSPQEKHHEAQEQEETIPAVNISPALERYIRRYIGLPGMLKAGEFSPNNPLLRDNAMPSSGDALRGLGEYERRRDTLRRIRQRQYKEFLDQQAKKKQEAKEQAERERREREEKERQRLERDRELERQRLEQENTFERRKVVSTHHAIRKETWRVDCGVQTLPAAVPRCVARGVQTDLYPLSGCESARVVTTAERELSPRTVAGEAGEEYPCPAAAASMQRQERGVKRTTRDRLLSDLQHTHMPSLYDEDRRNQQAEQEALERQQTYQHELRKQIAEQQRLREERRAREKLLEAAEMRRLEEQLRMLRTAQRQETDRQELIVTSMRENATDYEKKRTALQQEIDREQQSFLRAKSIPMQSHSNAKRKTYTSQSDTQPSKLPFYYPSISENSAKPPTQEKKPYSTNIPKHSIFSPDYDVDSYLRRNLNPSKESLFSNRFESLSRDHLKDTHMTDPLAENDTGLVIKENKRLDIDLKDDKRFDVDSKEIKQLNLDFKEKKRFSYESDNDDVNVKDVVVEAIVHERPKNKTTRYQPSNFTHNVKDKDSPAINEEKTKSMIKNDVDSLPIPVLRHSPISVGASNEPKGANVSDAMKLVEDKWKVPAVQKNILKSIPNEEGKNISILTQLGSIRRQLQLEQLKLDMIKNDKV